MIDFAITEMHQMYVHKSVKKIHLDKSRIDPPFFIITRPRRRHPHNGRGQNASHTHTNTYHIPPDIAPQTECPIRAATQV